MRLKLPLLRRNGPLPNFLSLRPFVFLFLDSSSHVSWPSFCLSASILSPFPRSLASLLFHHLVLLLHVYHFLLGLTYFCLVLPVPLTRLPSVTPLRLHRRVQSCGLARLLVGLAEGLLESLVVRLYQGGQNLGFAFY